MRCHSLRQLLRAGLCVAAWACGGSDKKEPPPPSFPNCPATTGVCSFTWSGASSGTLPCTVIVTLWAPEYWGDLYLAETTPIVWPDARAFFEIKAAPTAGSVIRTGDLYLGTAEASSSIAVIEQTTLIWGMWRDRATLSDIGDFALYIESANGAELHGHLSAWLENAEGAPGTIVYLCATF